MSLVRWRKADISKLSLRYGCDKMDRGFGGLRGTIEPDSDHVEERFWNDWELDG